MPISLPVPQNLERNLYQLLSEILRRADDGTAVTRSVVVTGASGASYLVGVDDDGALTVAAGGTGPQETNGVVLTSADGTRYRLGVTNDGALTTDEAATGIVLTAPNGAQFLLGVDTDEALTTTAL